MNSTIDSPKTSPTNWTFEDLKKLSDAKSDVLLPVKLVLGLYMVIGFMGNSLVCYVMGFKFKMNTQNMLIVYLAVFDLLNCLICIPAEIFELSYYFCHPSEVGCKITRMIMAFINGTSILTLLIIAVDRFRKVCQPMKRQMTLGHAKWLLVLVFFITLFLSWPSLVTFGFRTIDTTRIPGISGYNCDVMSDSLKGTPYPMVYTSILILLFIVICVCLCVLYLYVLVAARAHRSYMSSKLYPNHFVHHLIQGIKYSKNNDDNSVTTEDASVDRETHESLNHCSTSRQNSSQESFGMEQCNKEPALMANASDDEFVKGESRKKERKSSLKISRLDQKMTIIAFSVTVVFILSYLPFLGLQISKPLVQGHFDDQHDASLILYHIFLRSYYIDSMANSIIYGLLNNRFRHQVLDLLSVLFKCNTTPRDWSEQSNQRSH